MIEPNFGEGQLQQCVNTEITQLVFKSYGTWCNPVIITLPEEFGLGWDTGYYFPWLAVPASATNLGCNFFIQYKLSSLVETKRGAQFRRWQQPYFRFKITYSIKKNGAYAEDYHQWDAMKAAAGEGYPALYATNHVLKREQLFDLATHQRLVDEIPWLDVQMVKDRHKYVTFTTASAYFVLHSEPEEPAKFGGQGLLPTVTQAQQRTLDEDNTRTFELLSSALQGVEGAGGTQEAYRAFDRQEDPTIAAALRFNFLRVYYQRFLGTYLFRYTANAERRKAP